LERKGKIAPGHDADLVIRNPEEVQTVEIRGLQQRHKLTPYLGRTLPGVVHATYLRGTRIFERGRFPGDPTGELLLRKS
jgi:allantoinase